MGLKWGWIGLVLHLDWSGGFTSSGLTRTGIEANMLLVWYVDSFGLLQFNSLSSLNVSLEPRSLAAQNRLNLAVRLTLFRTINTWTMSHVGVFIFYLLLPYSLRF